MRGVRGIGAVDARTRDERGASAIIVALVLVVVFGMIVLTIDVGGLLLRRRGMINAADAGALAAAKSCAVVTDTSLPEAQADLFAADNVAGLLPDNGGVLDIANCNAPSGNVTVDYTTPQELIFAGVLGFEPTSPVNARATAIWGPAGGGNPISIVMNVGSFLGACRIPDQNASGGPLAIGDRCYYWSDSREFDGSNFGFANLARWGTSCSGDPSAAQQRAWIRGGWVGDELTLNLPTGATYVCADLAVANSVWNALRGEEGEIKIFPINDWDGSISGWSQLTSGSRVNRYQIVGFAALQIEDVLTVAQAGGTSGGCNENFQPFDSNGDIVGGESFSVNSFGSFNDCFAAAPDTITGFDIDPRDNDRSRTPDFVVCPSRTSSGCDYYFDPVTRNVTWLGAPTRASGTGEIRDDLRISFAWSNDGICGPAPGDPNARCMITSWQGDTVSGTCPNCGYDFGVRAIKLCEFGIAGSCPDPLGP